MENKSTVTIDYIIAKIDNDFNPDNSDWIARVPAWCYDAMSQLKLLRTRYKKRRLPVKDKIAYSPCPITNNKGLKVYDSNGCEIVNLKEAKTGCCFDTSVTGGQQQHDDNDDNNGNNNNSGSNDKYHTVDSGGTTSFVSGMSLYDHLYAVTSHKQTDVFNERHRVGDVYMKPINAQNRNYVIIDDNKIELNFDTDYIIVKNLEIETAKSKYFNSDIPVIPNNGYLIEALAFYCMYKMLCRGMKHPVFNLNASQYGSNPYYNWLQLKDKAKASIAADNVDYGNLDDKAWQSFFYNYTFKPRG